ncbi:MAG TPA: hypothetical protein VJU84_08725 [Pyrinomonadaceae bacterium]|nr:hypothetical protein [Pyrinomonadaceae bacterium]
MGFKYIVIEVERREAGKQRLPIIFPDIMVHAHVAEAVKKLPNFQDPFGSTPKVVSAGDVQITALCSGGSETLDLTSDEGDSSLINTFAYYHGLIL